MSKHLPRPRKKKKKKQQGRSSHRKGLPIRDTEGLSSEADMQDTAFEIRAEILKNQSFDEGLVLGWAIVCKEEGEMYFDLQDDHITEKAMLAATSDYAMNSRVATDMHGKEAGVVVHTFPLTTDIAKAFDIKTPKTGLMIAMKPNDSMLEKFKSGELTGFSIGGSRGEDEEVE